ncbi:EAL domain-containing protein [Vibrio diabolicus]|uniref:EAL domain-containing protein n=1 Tax=Vibrio diabolicus TaxID=50719 RepID=UPI002ED95E99
MFKTISRISKNYRFEYSNKCYGEFEFITQPIVEPLCLEIKGFEILSRIISSSGDRLNNEDFFEKIDNEFLKSIFLAQLLWVNRLNNTDYTFSLNLPINCLLDYEFVNKIIEINTVNIAIEINDFSNDFQINRIKSNIIRLKNKNIQFWLDDYNLDDNKVARWLHLVKWDALKIDKNYMLSERHSVYLPVIVNYLKIFSDTIIIEGVETNYQYDEYKYKNVLMQGYLFFRNLN